MKPFYGMVLCPSPGIPHNQLVFESGRYHRSSRPDTVRGDRLRTLIPRRHTPGSGKALINTREHRVPTMEVLVLPEVAVSWNYNQKALGIDLRLCDLTDMCDLFR